VCQSTAASSASCKHSRPPSNLDILSLILFPSALLFSRRLSTYGPRAFAIAGPTAWNSFQDNLLIRTLLQTISSACWKHFCSQRTSAISALDVLRWCALQIYILRTYLRWCDVVSGREAVRDRRARKDSVRRRSVWVADIERTAKTLDYNLINHVHTADVCNTINPQCIVLSSIRLLSFTNTVFCILPPQCLDAIIWTKELTAVKKISCFRNPHMFSFGDHWWTHLILNNMQNNRPVKQKLKFGHSHVTETNVLFSHFCNCTAHFYNRN